MRTKVSATLPQELLEAVDRRAKQENKTRSAFIEAAVWALIGQLNRNEQNARDLAIINRRAEFLNQEARDVLEYSVPPVGQPVEINAHEPHHTGEDY